MGGKTRSARPLPCRYNLISPSADAYCKNELLVSPHKANDQPLSVGCICARTPVTMKQKIISEAISITKKWHRKQNPCSIACFSLLILVSNVPNVNIISTDSEAKNYLGRTTGLVVNDCVWKVSDVHCWVPTLMIVFENGPVPRPSLRGFPPLRTDKMYIMPAPTSAAPIAISIVFM